MITTSDEDQAIIRAKIVAKEQEVERAKEYHEAISGELHDLFAELGRSVMFNRKSPEPAPTTHEKSVHAPKRRGRKPKGQQPESITTAGPGAVVFTTAPEQTGPIVFHGPAFPTESLPVHPRNEDEEEDGPETRAGAEHWGGQGVESPSTHPIGCEVSIPIPAGSGKATVKEAWSRRALIQWESGEELNVSTTRLTYLCEHMKPDP